MTEQDNQTGVDTETVTDDYDSPWKTAVEQYLTEFMAFVRHEVAYTTVFN